MQISISTTLQYAMCPFSRLASFVSLTSYNSRLKQGPEFNQSIKQLATFMLVFRSQVPSILIKCRQSKQDAKLRTQKKSYTQQFIKCASKKKKSYTSREKYLIKCLFPLTKCFQSTIPLVIDNNPHSLEPNNLSSFMAVKAL